ncbi:MAG: RNA polymerase sigma factor (sigma-70 family), partial [Verrucomicrobiales bacterium]
MEETQTVPLGEFPATRWSLVLQAKEGDERSRIDALGQLCERYWYPLYAFVRRRGYDGPDAEDLTQGFFGELLAKDRVQLFSEAKGRLRAYLLGAIKNYLANERAKANAQKRGGGVTTLSFDAATAEERYRMEPPNLDSPEKLFELRWALDLMESAFENLRGEYERAEKGALYTALKGHLSGAEPTGGYAEIAATLVMTEGAVRVALHRLRKRYRGALEEVIADTVADKSEVDAEIDYL